jgi:hypothetical protein
VGFAFSGKSKMSSVKDRKTPTSATAKGFAGSRFQASLLAGRKAAAKGPGFGNSQGLCRQLFENTRPSIQPAHFLPFPPKSPTFSLPLPGGSRAGC